MTDTPSSPTDPADDDLLASLYLDGEATGDERARVEADPLLLERVRAFEAIAEDLSNVTPPPDLRRLQISAALDLFDTQQTPAVLSATPASAPAVTATSAVTSLSERRERKQSRGIPTWLSAAAALALVVGGLGFASTLGGESDDATSADVAMDSGDEASASSANRQFDEADTTMADEDASAEAPEAASSEAMDDAAGVMEDEGDAQEELAEADDAMLDPSPIPLDGLDATTAAEYLELLGDHPLQPIIDSPCAGSPLVEGLFGVDSFLPVVFEGEISSLLVQDGVPSTAVIVGATCEIELE